MAVEGKKILSDLFQGFKENPQFFGFNEKGLKAETLLISGLSSDSRAAKSQQVFFSLAEGVDDSLRFIKEAIRKGAIAIVCSPEEKLLSFLKMSGMPYIVSEDPKELFSFSACSYYENPSNDVLSIAVTGTNGKTTIASLLSQSLACLKTKNPSFSSGTLGFYSYKQDAKGSKLEVKKLKSLLNTTPGPLVLQKLIDQSREEKASAFISEVSSHALVQGRADNINWDICIFSNLTRDHLDYHKDIESYFKAKAKLFFKNLRESTKKNKLAVFQIDNPLIKDLARKTKSLGIRTFEVSEKDERANFFVKEQKLSQDGIQFVLEVTNNNKPSEVLIKSSLIGDYNISNLSLVAATLFGLGFGEEEVLNSLSLLMPVNGRLEVVQREPFSVFIDYAHTPDALEKACFALKKITKGKLIVLFGCGGDRDKGKRAEMAKAAESIADYIFLTSDNPRSENPNLIISDIEKGFSSTFNSYKVEEDRESAIKEAVRFADKEDSILIAGKGHEDYQEIQGERKIFSDLEVSRKYLA